MSEFIHLEAFKSGTDHRPFDRAIVWDIFFPYIYSGVSGYWHLLFPDRSGGILYIDDTEKIDGFSIERPGGRALYDTVFLAMQRTPVVFYCDTAVAVADPALISDLPIWMPTAIREPIVVRCGADIIREKLRPKT